MRASSLRVGPVRRFGYQMARRCLFRCGSSFLHGTLVNFQSKALWFLGARDDTVGLFGRFAMCPGTGQRREMRRTSTRDAFRIPQAPPFH